MRGDNLRGKPSLNDLRQAVYQAYDAVLDSAKGGPGSTNYDLQLVKAYEAACEAYLQAKLQAPVLDSRSRSGISRWANMKYASDTALNSPEVQKKIEQAKPARPP
jgi:hypothetical protein